jgi:hypothetical protein
MPFYEYACDPCFTIYKARHGINAASQHAQLLEPDRSQVREALGER